MLLIFFTFIMAVLAVLAYALRDVSRPPVTVGNAGEAEEKGLLEAAS